eukprot:3080905-Rhodomonas_salina.6
MAEGTTEYEINLALAASKDECVPIYAALPLFCASGCVAKAEGDASGPAPLRIHEASACHSFHGDSPSLTVLICHSHWPARGRDL